MFKFTETYLPLPTKCCDKRLALVLSFQIQFLILIYHFFSFLDLIFIILYHLSTYLSLYLRGSALM